MDEASTTFVPGSLGDASLRRFGLAPSSPLQTMRRGLAAGTISPLQIAEECMRRANGNASCNTYLGFDSEELLAQARALPERFPDAAARPALYGIPVSLKDCFDLEGWVTTCGSKFYERRNGLAARDSAMARRLKASGGLIAGKTHLHPLAYGITGENAEYGDCVQPRDAGLLTGGSSSGAAASVQEGSALAAVGTDTGGSIRVPAALCGLSGYRCSQSLASPSGAWPGGWEGAAHLAPSFDTLGVICRDPRDLQPLAEGLFGVAEAELRGRLRIGFVPDRFLLDAEPEVLACYAAWKGHLVESGGELTECRTAGWEETTEIFAGIQAHEAAELHRGHFDAFEPGIAQRLNWGEGLSVEEVARLRVRHARFVDSMARLFDRFDLLVLPCSPMRRLAARADHAETRAAILRYTTPFSLAGLPAVTLSGEVIGKAQGSGIQVAAKAGADGVLLAAATWAVSSLVPGQLRR